MDFVGDEDAVRYALQHILYELEPHGIGSLPSAAVAREFMKELEARGWRVCRNETRVVGEIR
jgi:NADPH-dependent 2,4-dienoyl-CoA reductase/sulfur reductase-like enzyme